MPCPISVTCIRLGGQKIWIMLCASPAAACEVAERTILFSSGGAGTASDETGRLVWQEYSVSRTTSSLSIAGRSKCFTAAKLVAI